ncbi:AAA family ATPase (plasmid) [Aristophania vespae]|uniref:Chromosome partitioning protein ParA n=1 Tax=Aristophania vespae TaxID=2697033 RepID=A0A6P1NGF6_9PROT|nr:AAA family ATPase [Aristophania vespae]QHI96508.1 AAA family ATPase [Aristophania vespae]
MNGTKLREIREDLRLTQKELHEAIISALGEKKYDKTRISHWENDREKIPKDVIQIINKLIEKRKEQVKVIAFANQKGGVGKTTSALNIAAALKKNGLRVLLIDLDPQASASDWILREKSLECWRNGKTIYHALLKDTPLKECIIHSNCFEEQLCSFDMIPSHIHLSEADGRREPGFEHSLSEAIEHIANDYDYIIIDAPPNLGLLTYMALVAADKVIIPVQTEPPDAMGVALLLDTVSKVQRRLNSRLRIAGILPTRYNSRQAVDREVLYFLIQSVNQKAPVIEPIPDSFVFGNAAYNGKIAIEASPKTKAVGPYIRLASALAQEEPLPLALLNFVATEDEDEASN